MATTTLQLYGSNARQISPAVVNLFQANNNVDSLEFVMENYQQDNIDLSTLDPYAICCGNEFVGGLDEVILTSEVTEDGKLRVYWDLTLMTLQASQTITYQIVFKNNDGAVWTSYKAILFANESLGADEEIVAQYPTILKQMETRIETKTDEAVEGVVTEILDSVDTQVTAAVSQVTETAENAVTEITETSESTLAQVNAMADEFDAGVIYIPYGGVILPEYRISNRLYYQYLNAEHTEGQFEDSEGNVLVSAGGSVVTITYWGDDNA